MTRTRYTCSVLFYAYAMPLSLCMHACVCVCVLILCICCTIVDCCIHALIHMHVEFRCSWLCSFIISKESIYIYIVRIRQMDWPKNWVNAWANKQARGKMCSKTKRTNKQNKNVSVIVRVDVHSSYLFNWFCCFHHFSAVKIIAKLFYFLLLRSKVYSIWEIKLELVRWINEKWPKLEKIVVNRTWKKHIQNWYVGVDVSNVCGKLIFKNSKT